MSKLTDVFIMSSRFVDACVKSVIRTSLQIDCSWDSAIIVQGPYTPGITNVAILGFLQGFKDSLVIVSTYLPSAEENGTNPIGSFLSQSEKLAIQTGRLVFIFVSLPSPVNAPQFWNTNYQNQNCQRLTSFIGIRYAQRMGIKFSLKSRSDTYFGNTSIIDQFLREVETGYPLFPDEGLSSEIKGRIVVCGDWTLIRPKSDWDSFHVRDHWYFGHTSDLLKFFDCTSDSTWAEGNGILIRSPESASTRLWMSNMGIKVSSITELLARYFIVHDAVYVEQLRIKSKHCAEHSWNFDLQRYHTEGKTYLSAMYLVDTPPRFQTTHDEWHELYRSMILERS